jgi:hypothetical protein
VADRTAPNILWLKGFPGSGKTAIAWSLVTEASAGPHFFFRRDNSHNSTTSALWFTVAAHLAASRPMFGKLAVDSVQKLESKATAPTASDIFSQLIFDALTRTCGTAEDTSCLIVVDGIDECVGLDGGERELRSLLGTLCQWRRLSPHLKLLITSRNEHLIVQDLQAISYNIELDLGGKDASDDIHLFLENGFRQIKELHPRSLALLEQWPADGVIEEVTRRAGGLFIWAETLLRFLRDDPEKRLARILNGDMGTKGLIHELYQKILEISFLQAPEARDTNDIRTVLGAIILSPTPLTFQQYVDFVLPNIGVPSSTFDDICRRLGSVLDDGGGLQDIVQFHHQSFIDFLLLPSCPPDLQIDMHNQRINITEAYLRTLRARLSFNICHLESSCVSNSELVDLAERKRQHIPPDLSYSSVRWADHLGAISGGPAPPSLHQQISDFLKTKFLFWLEVCSLNDGMDDCVAQLEILRVWSKVGLSFCISRCQC